MLLTILSIVRSGIGAAACPEGADNNPCQSAIQLWHPFLIRFRPQIA